MSILVIDAGTSGIRAVVVHPDGSIAWERHAEAIADTPVPGLVEFDAAAYARTAVALAAAALDAAGPVEGIGISNQRASTIVWDRASGAPVASTRSI